MCSWLLSLKWPPTSTTGKYNHVETAPGCQHLRNDDHHHDGPKISTVAPGSPHRHIGFRDHHPARAIGISRAVLENTAGNDPDHDRPGHRSLPGAPTLRRPPCGNDYAN